MSAPRPKLLGFITLLMIIVAALQVLAGIFVIIERNKKEIIDALESTKADVTAVGIVMIIAGLLGLLVATSLRSGKNWARLLVGIVALGNLIVLVWSAISYHSLHWYNVAWPALIYALIAGYLFSDNDVKAYFAD